MNGVRDSRSVAVQRIKIVFPLKAIRAPGITFFHSFPGSCGYTAQRQADKQHLYKGKHRAESKSRAKAEHFAFAVLRIRGEPRPCLHRDVSKHYSIQQIGRALHSVLAPLWLLFICFQRLSSQCRLSHHKSRSRLPRDTPAAPSPRCGSSPACRFSWRKLRACLLVGRAPRGEESLAPPNSQLSI